MKLTIILLFYLKVQGEKTVYIKLMDRNVLERRIPSTLSLQHNRETE